MHLGDYHELLVTNRIWTEPTAHRAAADRPHRAHGERDPEILAQRIRDDRGIQHDGRRGRRAVPDPGRRQLPDQLQRRGAAAADQHRQQRGAVRRLCPGDARHQARAAVGLPAQGAGESLRQHDLEGRPAATGASRTSAATRWRWTAPPDPARFSEILHKVGDAARDANRVEVPFEFIAPKPDQYWTFDSSKGGGHSAGPRRRHQAPALEAGQGDVAARADRRQDGLGQVDACCTP